MRGAKITMPIVESAESVSDGDMLEDGACAMIAKSPIPIALSEEGRRFPKNATNPRELMIQARNAETGMPARTKYVAMVETRSAIERRRGMRAISRHDATRPVTMTRCAPDTEMR